MDRSDYFREHYEARKRLAAENRDETYEDRHRLRRYEEELKAKELLAIQSREPEIEESTGQTFSGVIGAFQSLGKQKRYGWRAI